jgi:hypothetical protein
MNEASRLSELFAEVTAFVLEHPEVLEVGFRGDSRVVMSDDFQLVTLPLSDPSLVKEALALAEQKSDKPLVYALFAEGTITFLLPQGPPRVNLQAA